MSRSPLVGIYMPAWNVAKYIGETIKSIYAQDLDDWEMVIIDDASTDGTFEAAGEALEKCEDGRGRTFVARNGDRTGLIGRLKNEAISLLDECGFGPKYICHVGADDTIPPDCLSSFVRFMEANPSLGAACGTFEAFDDTGRRWMFPHVTRDKGFSSERLLRYMCMYPHRFYRRDAVRAVGGYSDELSSAVDYDLALKLDEKFEIGRLEGKITYHYRQHPTQVSRKDRVEQNLNAKRALQAAMDRRHGKGIMTVANDAPPFVIDESAPEHFIWGKQ